MTRALVVVVVAALVAPACATSSYAAANVAPDEIVWDFDGDLAARRRGAEVARGPRWVGLADAVACVPAAHEHAVLAEEHGQRFVVLAWTAASLGVAAPVAAVALVLSSSFVGGFGGYAALAALPAGAVLLASAGVAGLWGWDELKRARPAAVDAVNIYEDGRAGCVSDPTTGSP